MRIDPRKAEAHRRARSLYAKHLRRTDDLGAIAWMCSGGERDELERQLIESIAIAIYDAATTGQP